ncbi:hypothetical protein NDI85_05710 [Halomicroarcula sp. S1AR25-4]|uniref:hypothetical protein n=1 Tax=Haloarcula sp. S1AR25-4 TaxID=2950538 RepID=UPI002875DCF4|nr:hypothetical protein [Halomicroarcula sp. S1AR25-4]MDS0277280.1 hypothetical protein [Halomicroarcula sp. S1AR25-4]
MTTTTERRNHEPIETVAELLDAIEGRPSLGVEADLDVEVDGYGLTVVGYDDVVAVDLPSLPAALSLWRRLPVDTMDVAAALASVGLTVEVQTRGVPVARIGAAADPSPVARRLGLGPVELVPEGPVLAAVTRRRG